jgi:hypothetical protein
MPAFQSITAQPRVCHFSERTGLFREGNHPSTKRRDRPQGPNRVPLRGAGQKRAPPLAPLASFDPQGAVHHGVEPLDEASTSTKRFARCKRCSALWALTAPARCKRTTQTLAQAHRYLADVRGGQRTFKVEANARPKPSDGFPALAGAGGDLLEATPI